ncbi:hypothetical protein [Pendulispora albinea]|uniref:Uncharacterized protein n=1 Tax=Pendulispora albinea TaxID=2741071 RepID=A0ABZ2LPD8_9BACT
MPAEKGLAHAGLRHGHRRHGIEPPCPIEVDQSTAEMNEEGGKATKRPAAENVPAATGDAVRAKEPWFP